MPAAKGNPQRAESRVTHAGKTWTLRPDFNALCTVEGITGVSFITLLGRAVQGDLRLGDMAAVLAECSKAAGGEMPADVIADLVQTRFAEAVKLVGEVIGNAFQTAEEPAANPPPAA